MRIVEKLLYGICGIIGLLLLFILLCHFNPSLSNGFGKDTNSEAVVNEKTEGGSVEAPEYNSGKDGNTVSSLQPSTDNSLTNPETEKQEIENKEIENIVMGTSIYEVPDVSALEIPNKVLSLMGMEVPEGKKTEVSEKRAEELKEELSIGRTGEDYSYEDRMYPYYYMLDDVEKKLYRQMHANAEDLLERFAPVEKNATSNQLKNAFTALVNDHPELFWLNTGYGYYIDPSNKLVEIDLLYNFTSKDLEKYKKEFEEAANEIIYGSRGAGNEYKQEVYVHDALCDLIKYDLNAPANQSAYSALVTNRTVCAGYARAFQYIMQKLNIPCYYCAGYAGQNHAWNIIKIDGDYYNVDVTWDDQSPEIYDFFNCSDNDYKNTHIRRDLSINLPACLGTKYSGLEQNKVEDKTNNSSSDTNNSTSKVDSNTSEETKNNATSTVTEDKANNTTTVTETTIITTNNNRVIYDNQGDYYLECAHRMMENKGNYIVFTLYLEDEDLWEELKEQYIDGSYQDAYLERVLAERHAKGATTSVTGEVLSDGTVKVTHAIQIY